jgi:hypothetical protein
MNARPHFKTVEVLYLTLKPGRQSGAAEAGVHIATVTIATAETAMLDISLTNISVLLFVGARRYCGCRLILKLLRASSRSSQICCAAGQCPAPAVPGG